MMTFLPDEQSETLVSLNDLRSLQDTGIAGADLAQRPLNEMQVTSLMMADPASLPAIVLTRTDMGAGHHRWRKRERLSCSS